MVKKVYGQLSKVIILASMMLVMTGIAMGQTTFTRNGDFDITQNLNVSGSSNLSGDVFVGGVISGDGSGLTNLNLSGVEAYDDSGVVQNMTTFFANISENRDRIDAVNASIMNTPGITNIGSDGGNFSTNEAFASVNFTGQEGGISSSVAGNIISYTLNAVNSVITTFTNLITFNGGIQVNGDANVTGTLNATSFIGDGSQLTGVTAATADNATFAASAGNATFAALAGDATNAVNAQNADNATYAATAGNATFAAGVNCEDVNGEDACDDEVNDGQWVPNGNQLNLNSTYDSVGIGTQDPKANLEVVGSSRVSLAVNNRTFDHKEFTSVAGIGSGGTTAFTISLPTLTGIEAMGLLKVNAFGVNTPAGIGGIESTHTITISGGTITTQARSSDVYNPGPKVTLGVAGSSVNINVASFNAANTFNGTVEVEFLAMQGGGSNGESIAWSIS